MALKQKAINDNLRNKFMEMVKLSIEQLDYDVLTVNSNEFAIPCLDEVGNDSFITIKVSVPTGSRDGDAYDGYSLADEYAEKVAEKAKKAEEAKIAKEKKIARDKANREKLAQSKALHEAK